MSVFYIRILPYPHMDSSCQGLTQKRFSDSKNTDLVDLQKVKKILELLAEECRVKGTHLSAKAGMNYSRCMRYIKIMRLIKLVEVVFYHDCNYVMITKTGMEIINLLDYI